MEELELLKKQLEVAQKEMDVLSKGIGLEFDKIGKAFSQMGNLLDLLYLETSALIEMCVSKNLFTKEEFTKTLEDTAKKVQAEIEKANNKPEVSPIIT